VASSLLSLHGAALTAIVGEAFVREETVAPADVAQLSAVLRYADANALAVMPVGGETKLGWGHPVQAAVIVDMRRMNVVREHAWQDMTCTVQAGCTWSAMQAALAVHGQTVALDALWPDAATVGGVIAANDSGVLRLKYGGLRDLIIGMTVVLADGTIAKTGGKVVKNVAGYDLHKLMTGAFGTLGVIAEVNFRLHPVEKSLQTWSITASDAFELDRPLRAVLDGQLAPVSAQVRCGAKSAALDVRLAVSDRASQQRAVEDIAGALPIALAEENVWSERQRLVEDDGLGERVTLKISLPQDEICNFLARVQHIPPEVCARAVAQAHGLAMVTLDGAPTALARMVRTLRTEVAELGGSVFVQTVPAGLRDSIEVWGETATLPLLREIKRQFDPKRTLNPGRFVGGI
jgi:glycolate oxidase FAD binding subunit